MTIDKYRFETGVYRPPSEGGSASLLVRFTRNCPWNHCTFCSMYKTEKFQLRPLSEILADIDAMAALTEDIKALSAKSASNGGITREGVMALLEKNPELEYHPGAAMLINWLMAGGRTAFIQDANSLIMKTPDLVKALEHLKATFPNIARITTYARARTLAQKPAKDLETIRNAGLDRLHLGLETGDDDLLKAIKKGVTADGQIKAGKKAVAAGFQVSEYWMPGLGGKEKTHDHAKNTARVLNAINPHYIRSRPFRPIPGTPLHQQVQAGDITLLTAREQLEELKAMIQDLEVTGKVCFDHAMNYWQRPGGSLLLTHDYEGYKFPEEKSRLLALFEEGLGFDQEPPRRLHL
ncbi:MAG TPA: radical SAM protein [Desulfotignum sp.]|nr:radical SAM protein [Desulfotignum sp.]